VSGCEKLTVFDWLSDMELPSQAGTFDVIEVRFKNGRKEYLRNPQQLRLYMGDVVAVEGSPGHDVGAVSLTGELVRLQLKKRKIDPEKAELKKIFRKANPRDISLWKEAQEREEPALIRGREIIQEMGLPMKLSDVEYQADKAKATFYFTAEGRVDFRALIKRLATEFHIRVEMRQIGSRQEAGRIGGIGSCGRELCCSTWLTDFRSVSTSAARYQQLSLNPQKLAGQCGKLKCCLNFELDTYLDALKQFPKTQSPLYTQKGKAHFQKMDIFKEIMWYAYEEEGSEWVALHRDTVKKLQNEMQEGQKPESLEVYSLSQPEPQVAYQNAVGDEDLTRFDHKAKKSRKKGRKPRQRGKNKAQNPQKRGRA
jgi:cell fate regulator YaaT (PSP1 superfamily)